MSDHFFYSTVQCKNNFFLIFINNITNGTESFDYEVNINMFADDTKIFGTCPIKLQSAIDSMSIWLEDAKLKLAPQIFLLLPYTNHT